MSDRDCLECLSRIVFVFDNMHRLEGAEGSSGGSHAIVEAKQWTKEKTE